MLVGRGRGVKAWGTSPPRSSPPVQAAAKAPAPCLSFPSRSPPGLTSGHLFPSCRCTLGGSREVGAQVVQIPPSPTWCAGEGPGARRYKPEAPGDLRPSAQGPAAGEQSKNPGFWLLGSQTPGLIYISGPAPQSGSAWPLPQPETAPPLTLPPPRTSSSGPAHLK